MKILERGRSGRKKGICVIVNVTIFSVVNFIFSEDKKISQQARDVVSSLIQCYLSVKNVRWMLNDIMCLLGCENVHILIIL